MREEISEPQHWRGRSTGNVSWSSRRRPVLPLPADVVDAAFSEEVPLPNLRTDAAEIDAQTYPELIATLTEQLAQLDAQREQLTKLLGQAK